MQDTETSQALGRARQGMPVQQRARIREHLIFSRSGSGLSGLRWQRFFVGFPVLIAHDLFLSYVKLRWIRNFAFKGRARVTN